MVGRFWKLLWGLGTLCSICNLIELNWELFVKISNLTHYLEIFCKKVKLKIEKEVIWREKIVNNNTI